MRENRERPFEVYEEYAGFKQHDTVEATTVNGIHFLGEVKSFTHYQDTGEVVANIIPKPDQSVQGDVHVDPKSLKLKIRLGRRGVNLGPKRN